MLRSIGKTGKLYTSPIDTSAACASHLEAVSAKPEIPIPVIPSGVPRDGVEGSIDPQEVIGRPRNGWSLDCAPSVCDVSVLRSGWLG